VPDFAAQATRAAIFAKLGNVTWWPGWYGGLELPTYSVIAPGLMATIGVATTGALASAICMWAAHQLFRDSARPRAASVVFAASVLINPARRAPRSSSAWRRRCSPFWRWSAAPVARRDPDCASVLEPAAGLFTGMSPRPLTIPAAAERAATGSPPAPSLGTRREAPQPRRDGIAAGQMPCAARLALVGIVVEPTIRVGAVIVAIGLVAIVPNSVGLNLTWMVAARRPADRAPSPDRHVVALTLLALIFPGRRHLALAEADRPRHRAYSHTAPRPRADEHRRHDRSGVEVVESDGGGPVRRGSRRVARRLNARPT
jgi:hypothetical protein